MGALTDLVGKARRGVLESKLELEEHLRPLVHGLLLAWVPHRVAGPQVRRLITEAFANSATSDAQFLPTLMSRARSTGQDAQRAAPNSADPPPSDPALREALSLLGRLRRLPERQREVSAMRLVEGIGGPEISEALGASESDVTGWLEGGLPLLLDAGVKIANDPYLWNLSGAPHSAVVRFENLLTPLRFDDAAQPVENELETNPVGVPPVDVTPVSGPNPLPVTTEGKRGTSEFKPMGASPPLPEVRRSRSGLNPVLTTPPKLPDPTDPSGSELISLGDDDDFDDQTEALVSDPRRSNPFAAQPGTIAASDLPAAAFVNPFAAMPSTVAANELPAAARAVPAGGPVPSAPMGKRPTGAHPPPNLGVPTAPVQAYQKPVFDPEATGIQDPPPQGQPIGQEEVGTAALKKPTFHEEENPTRVQPVGKPSVWKSSLFAEDDDEASITLPVPERNRLLRKQGVWRGRAPFLLAGMAASLAFSIAWMTVVSSSRRAKQAWNLVPVSVAATDLSEGSVMTMEMVSTRSIPEQFVTASVVKPDGYSYVIGQKTLVPVQAGDPLLWSHFELAQTTERLSRRVVKKSRAITVSAGGSTTVGGWVRPGDWVDVILSLKDGPKGGQRAAVTLMQDVPVVATGKISEKTNYGLLSNAQRNYSTVSLLLLPEEAEIVTLASEVGNFKFTLRNERDHDVQRDGYGTNAKTLLDGARVKLLQMRRLATIQNIREARTNETPHPGGHRIEPKPQ